MITAYEFKEVMTSLGYNYMGEVHNYGAEDGPCFQVGEFFLVHDTNYVWQRNGKFPREIFDRAMEEVDEKDLFYVDEIFSIRALLTVLAMFENSYNKEFVDRFINETYKGFLENPIYYKKISYKTPDKRLREMSALIKEFDGLVNPLGNKNLTLRDPIEYIDQIQLNVDYNKEKKSCKLKFRNWEKGFFTEFCKKPVNFVYRCRGDYYEETENEYKGFVEVTHYNDWEDEVVRIDFAKERHMLFTSEKDFQISLTKGLFSDTWTNLKPTFVTDDQIKLTIKHLKSINKRMQKTIIDKIVK